MTPQDLARDIRNDLMAQGSRTYDAGITPRLRLFIQKYLPEVEIVDEGKKTTLKFKESSE